MRSLSTLLLLALVPFPIGAQTDTRQDRTRPRPTSQRPAPKASPTPPPRDDKAEFEAAKATADALERLNSLLKFIADFPESKETPRARELSVSARAEVAEAKLAAGETEEGVRQFLLAAESAPVPVSDELFSKVLLQFPTNLFARNQRAAAFDVAAVIERKSAGNAKQLLALATFYIGVEYSSEAFRLAEKGVEAAPDLALGYYTLGTAARLGFRLDDASSAFAKALELEPESIAARRNLADLRRATGKSEDAVKLYGEIVTKDPEDVAARSALALALFDLGKREEAEKEMDAALSANPTDGELLTGAAFWYATNGEGAKAIGLGARAKAADPKNVWAYIAEARGHLAQRNPLEAERVLLLAKTVGNFPTLDYELASARYAAGLYREAVEALAANFSVKDGLVSTYLGNRVLADAETLPQLLSLEHKAAILAPNLAHDAKTGSGLKTLLEFAQAIGTKGAPDEKSAVAAAETFASGEDNMRSHRQLFAASRLLLNNIAVDKALELTRASIAGLDSSVDIDAPAAAVLADELYESRVTALERGELVIVPRIDKQTLTSIMRGRVEELSGWALLLKNEPEQAILRIRRGLTVLPEDSAWWRSSQWRLGNALEAQGKQKEAIEAYIRSFNKEYPNPSQYQYIENLWMQVNGNLDGLEARIGRNPAAAVAEVKSTPVPTPVPTPEVVRIPDFIPIASPTPTPEAKVDESPKEVPSKIEENVPNVEPKAEPTPESTPIPVEEKKEEPKVESSSTPTTPPTPSTPEPTPIEEKKEDPKPESSSTPPTPPTPSTPATPESAPVEEKKEEQKVEPTPAPVEDKKEDPKVESSSTPTTPPTPSTPESAPVEEKKEEQKVEPTPAPVEDKKEDPKPESSSTPTTPSTPSTPSTPAPPEPTPVEEKKEQKPAPKPLFEPIIINAPARTAPSEARPRVVAKTPEVRPCTISPTRESVSIFANGGLWGLLVGIENGNPDDLTAASENPSDVTVTPEKGPDGEKERRFFVIRSVSERTGDFKITFTAPCGSKDVAVSVRGL